MGKLPGFDIADVMKLVKSDNDEASGLFDPVAGGKCFPGETFVSRLSPETPPDGITDY
jgi:hypothetical protein